MQGFRWHSTQSPRVSLRPAPVCPGDVSQLLRQKSLGEASFEASLRGRRAHPLSGEYALNEHPILNYGYATYQHKRNPLRVLQRLFVRSFVNDRAGIKDGDVRVGAHANSPFVFE